MVLAISFLEAPLKFRAPDVTLRIGLGIGRLVFRALNTVETVLAVLIGTALALSSARGPALIGFAVAATMLAVQILVVRPRLSRRSDAVLAAPSGGGAPARSRAHYAYVGLELAKVAALVVTGVALLR
ncbi:MULTISPECIES: hypothetical protein [Mycobacteriaceae]|nr:MULTISPECIES: hypothetical protein [Mycobacteriaceae]AMO08384.1 membrane protein [Mycolicibacterium neoaurum]KUM08402.1 hypothetical protein AVZ31_11780 [Mycolicibacterium neoaurum]MDO3399311.1 hypothetical protein [Mycolicibacterium neoaurum]